jgi:hypothetical protein
MLPKHCAHYGFNVNSVEVMLLFSMSSNYTRLRTRRLARQTDTASVIGSALVRQLFAISSSAPLCLALLINGFKHGVVQNDFSVSCEMLYRRLS